MTKDPERLAAPLRIALSSPLERLVREPARFSLDQATVIVAKGADALDVSFRSHPRLGYPAGEVAQADLEACALVTPTFGLIGPGGTLPSHVTATVGAELRQHAGALHAFLDLLATRFTGSFVKAGRKYRPARNPAPTARVLSAAIGLGTQHLDGRLAAPLSALLYHAGNLASRTRSAERLRAMLEEEAGIPVEIIEFVGGWIRLPAAERSVLPSRRQPQGQHARLGSGAALGAEVWDAQARFSIRLGPLSRERFESLLPGQPLHARLVDLVRLHAGLEQDFVLNPVLAAAAVPPFELGNTAHGGRLGWTSWLTTATPRRRDGVEPMLGPTTAPGARNSP